MDFIERIFHVSPDGGTGLLELAFVLAVLVIPLAVSLMLRNSRSRGRY
jgi:hypothetical protein